MSSKDHLGLVVKFSRLEPRLWQWRQQEHPRAAVSGFPHRQPTLRMHQRLRQFQLFDWERVTSKSREPFKDTGNWPVVTVVTKSPMPFKTCKLILMRVSRPLILPIFTGLRSLSLENLSSRNPKLFPVPSSAVSDIWR